MKGSLGYTRAYLKTNKQTKQGKDEDGEEGERRRKGLGRVKGINRVRERLEAERLRRGQTAPFIASQAYLAVAR